MKVKLHSSTWHQTLSYVDLDQSFLLSSVFFFEVLWSLHRHCCRKHLQLSVSHQILFEQTMSSFLRVHLKQLRNKLSRTVEMKRLRDRIFKNDADIILQSTVWESNFEIFTLSINICAQSTIRLEKTWILRFDDSTLLIQLSIWKEMRRWKRKFNMKQINNHCQIHRYSSCFASSRWERKSLTQDRSTEAWSFNRDEDCWCFSDVIDDW